MALGKQQFLALDWDRNNLRFVVVNARSDGIDLAKAVSAPIPPEIPIDDATQFGAFVREALRQSHIGARRTLLAVPREQVVLNTLNLPPTPADDLASIVQFQIVKELPFSAGEATLDFAICGEFDPTQPSSALVAAVRNEVVEFLKKFAAEAGLTLQSIGLRPFSNLLAITANVDDYASKTLLAVEVGPRLTEIDIIKLGVLTFSRSASAAMPSMDAPNADALKDSRIVGLPVQDRQQDEAAERTVSNLMVDIIRSVEAFRATDPTFKIDEIVVCGTSGLEPQVAQALAARYATRAELYMPARSLGLSQERARELRGFSAAIGLAIGHRRKGLDHLDFLRPKKSISRRTRRMRKVPFAMTTAALIIFSGIAYRWRFISPLQEQVAELREVVSAKSKEKRRIEEFKDKVESLEAWMDSEHYWPEVLVALSEVFPDQKSAYATRVDFETRAAAKTAIRQSTARVRFRSAVLGAVNELSTRLRENGFDEIVPGKETHSPAPDGYTNESGVEFVVPLRRTWREARGVRIEPEETADEAATGALTPAADLSSKAGAAAGAGDPGGTGDPGDPGGTGGAPTAARPVQGGKP
jgi:Tfp pilus assembly PilM family ATPase